jgi:hypothetical protein
MDAFVKFIFGWLPLWFGAFFLGPLVAELLTRTALQQFLPTQTDNMLIGLSLTHLCMVAGGLYGLTAKLTGRWI